jgi:hypothetical protein
MSRRMASGSTRGKVRRLAMRSAAAGLRRVRGRNSATSVPSRVDDGLAPSNPIQHFSPVISQVTNCY